MVSPAALIPLVRGAPQVPQCPASPQVPIWPLEVFSPSKASGRDNLLGNTIASGTSGNKSVGTGSFSSGLDAFPYPGVLLF